MMEHQSMCRPGDEENTREIKRKPLILSSLVINYRNVFITQLYD